MWQVLCFIALHNLKTGLVCSRFCFWGLCHEDQASERWIKANLDNGREMFDFKRVLPKKQNKPVKGVRGSDAWPHPYRSLHVDRSSSGLFIYEEGPVSHRKEAGKCQVLLFVLEMASTILWLYIPKWLFRQGYLQYKPWNQSRYISDTTH